MPKFEGAIMELRAQRSKAGLVSLSPERLGDIDAALHFLETAARIDGARCHRALVSHMADWRVNANVKLDLIELVSAFEGLPIQASEIELTRARYHGGVRAVVKRG